MTQVHRVENVVFSRARMSFTVDGKRYSCSLAGISSRLARARSIELRQFEVSPSGYGIHWPLLDEDLAVESLVRAAMAEADETEHRACGNPASVMVTAEESVPYGKAQRKKPAARHAP